MSSKQDNSRREAAFGIYHTREQAERGVEDLLTAGFSTDDISVLLSPDTSSRTFAHEKNSKAPEGASAGDLGGGFIGGALGLLASLGVIVFPGIGALIAAGPILAGIAGVGAGGTLGGFIGGMVGFGIPEYEARRFEGHLKKGGVLLSVHCHSSDRLESALSLLSQTGAQDIAHSVESRADYPAPRVLTIRA